MRRRPRTDAELNDAWAERCWRLAFLNAHPRCQIGPVLAAAGRPEARRCRTWAVELHERKKRSRLGSTTDAANTIPACRPCHDWTEADVDGATGLGLLVHTWEDPALIPIGPRADGR